MRNYLAFNIESIDLFFAYDSSLNLVEVSLIALEIPLKWDQFWKQSNTFYRLIKDGDQKRRKPTYPDRLREKWFDD